MQLSNPRPRTPLMAHIDLINWFLSLSCNGIYLRSLDTLFQPPTFIRFMPGTLKVITRLKKSGLMRLLLKFTRFRQLRPTGRSGMGRIPSLLRVRFYCRRSRRVTFHRKSGLTFTLFSPRNQWNQKLSVMFITVIHVIRLKFMFKSLIMPVIFGKIIVVTRQWFPSSIKILTIQRLPFVGLFMVTRFRRRRILKWRGCRPRRWLNTMKKIPAAFLMVPGR